MQQHILEGIKILSEEVSMHSVWVSVIWETLFYISVLI